VLHVARSGHEHCFCHLPAGTLQERVYKASGPYLLKLETEKLAHALVKILLTDGISIFLLQLVDCWAHQQAFMPYNNSSYNSFAATRIFQHRIRQQQMDTES